ncbi:MAG TPA: glycosyltransferase [Novosphingobium sp.]|nr:glycosyltransferase [Novosphingobium sp.]
MRVLSISTLYPYPARPSFGVFVGNQMRAVAARGDVDLTVISPIGIPPWPLSTREPYHGRKAIPDSASEDAPTVHYPRFTLIPKIGGDSNPGRIARAILPLARRLHREKPFDLIDASFFFPDGPAAARVARELGLPLTIKARGADIHHWGARPKALVQMLAAADRAAALLSVSAALGRDMAALGMAADKIHVHYTGLDRDRFRPTDRAAARAGVERVYRIPPQGPLLLAAGALIERKGQRLAIEALARLLGARLLGARLALVGSGEDEGLLRRRAAELGLADRVHFLGVVSHDHLPELLRAADVMVLPSASEGLANVWVEALACGTPIVIPDIGGAREVVKEPSAGRIAPRNPAGIAAALSELLAAPPSQADAAGNVAQFSWRENAARIVDIWRGVI